MLRRVVLRLHLKISPEERMRRIFPRKQKQFHQQRTALEPRLHEVIRDISERQRRRVERAIDIRDVERLAVVFGLASATEPRVVIGSWLPRVVKVALDQRLKTLEVHIVSADLVVAGAVYEESIIGREHLVHQRRTPSLEKLVPLAAMFQDDVVANIVSRSRPGGKVLPNSTFAVDAICTRL